MATDPHPPDAKSVEADGPSINRAPALSLPKGGGAIRGIGEQFGINPVNGTGTLNIPIFTTPGRSDFYPKLSLSYDSGAGNGAFGFGWHLSVPAITRKTDKGLPRYDDGNESDVFMLSGAEDLVSSLISTGNGWSREAVQGIWNGRPHTVRRYRPRVEGLFALIERWCDDSDGQTFWRTVSNANLTSLYGTDPASRIADPAGAGRVFSWLLAATYDDRGNATAFTYKPEDNANLPNRASEQNRALTANRYLKRIQYGNQTPYDPTIGPALPTDWCFETVLDYGEHDPSHPLPIEDGLWRCRPDPFSSYRSGFEIRTYRICSRVLMFHHFPTELGATDYLVHATAFAWSFDAQPADPRNPIYAFLQSVQQIGYVKTADGGGYGSQALPPVEFTYSQSEIDDAVRFVEPDSLENLPRGADGSQYQWVDLDGEGSPGILSEHSEGWFYKRNISALPAADGTVAVRFEAVGLVTARPSPADLHGGGQQLLDLAGDGHLCLVQFSRPLAGFYERRDDGHWRSFTPFANQPAIDWKDPNLRMVDLDGDGHADVLLTQDEVLTWYPSMARDGYGPSQWVRKPFDENEGPALVFADGTQSLYLADMSGDGLSDLVRVRNGEICYWPNLGYGRFGAKITMDAAPVFDAPDLFDQRRLRIADIDGSGSADLIYLGRGRATIWFNQSGNGWSSARDLPQFPAVDDIASVQAVDLLGNGTACLVWSSPAPAESAGAIRYIDLMGGQKPHLLTGVKNNLGAESRIEYAASTRFYLADRQAGRPWATRLSFPVHVVSRVEAYDWVSRNRFVSRYAYHHGYYDGIEREFRGFGMVEQEDTEELGALGQTGAFPAAANVDAASYVPTVLTKTWFHTGAYPRGPRISRIFEDEYYGEADAGLTAGQVRAMRLPDTVLPPDLAADEIQEAIRALKGSILRQEVYALDGSEAAARPYSVAEKNYTVRRIQPLGDNLHAVFFTHARESIDLHYERKLYDVGGRNLADPRVTHSLVLSVDEYGNELQSSAVAYGRRHPDPDPALTAADRDKQSKIRVTQKVSTYTAPILPGSPGDPYRAPLPADMRAYELINVAPDAAAPDVTNLFEFDEISQKAALAGDGAHDLPFEDTEAAGATTAQPYRRLLKQARTLYRKDDLSSALPLGALESRALPFDTYHLALTPGLLALFQRDGQDLLVGPPSNLALGGYVPGDDPKAAGLFPSSDPVGEWWAPSGRIFYSPGTPDSSGQIQDDAPASELAAAVSHFFLARRYKDPFGNSTTVDYDSHDLLVAQTTDAIHNIVAAGNNYRVMQPETITDPNGNLSATAFDTIGLVAGSAVMGKTAAVGDSLTGFAADLDPVAIETFFGDPIGQAAVLLAAATSRIVYDLDRFRRTSAAAPDDPSQWEPAYAATIVRETHVSDLMAGQSSKLQVSFTYSDGFGREIQHKMQAEPGPIGPDGPMADPRWVGSGWTIFNNKGKPVRNYEPFFDDTHDFKFGAVTGVSPILFYDPVDRVVATLKPDQSWEKFVFGPWRQESWDGNDTVLIDDPSTDADVGKYFQRIPTQDYQPTWHAQRIVAGGTQQDAAEKAAAHASTPAVSHFDSLGRVFLTVADNAADGKYQTRTEWDVEGKSLSAADALQRVIMTYDYEMQGAVIHQDSADAGERWMLNDAAGKPFFGWNSRGFQLQHAYDALRRPIGLSVQDANGSTFLTEKTIYGEGQANDQNRNLRGKVFQSLDGAGVVTHSAYDFKGNLLASSRQLLQNYNSPQPVDWSQAPGLENETFAQQTAYDALNRAIALTTPDASVVRPAYNEANLLERIDVNLRGASNATPFVANIDYDAKGRRMLIEYGNGAETAYAYDPATLRLTELKTTRSSDGATLQDLAYAYDPVGNITQIQDDAQQIIYFNGAVVTPNSDYTYDALYRLTRALGREHIGQVVTPQPPPQYDWQDAPRINLPHPNDGQAMQGYAEQYAYDAVGNILQMIHAANVGGWTRDYAYSAGTPPALNNRLQSTSLPGDPDAGPYSAKYAYDPHGNMIQMPHLPMMAWDFKDQLQATLRQVVSNGGSSETTYYVYDSSGQRVRKVTETINGPIKNERIYLGPYEVYREYDNRGSVILERQTLHIMDDKRRIALVESRALGTDPGPSQFIRYQFGNHLGSASLELDDQTQIISYEEYTPYGGTSYQAVSSQTETPKRYRYSGKERDEESGFYYHVRRYYACWLGRWTSCDPLMMRESTNLFQFARNNPVLFIDLNGKESVEASAAAPSPAVDDNGMKLSPQQAALYSGSYSAALKSATKRVQELAKEGVTANLRSQFIPGNAGAGDASFGIAVEWVQDNQIHLLAYSASQTIGEKGQLSVTESFKEFEGPAFNQDMLEAVSRVLEGAAEIREKVDNGTTAVMASAPLAAAGMTYLPIPEKTLQMVDKALPAARRITKITGNVSPFVEAGLTAIEGVNKSIQTGSVVPLERAEGRVAGTIAGEAAGEALGTIAGGWVGGVVGLAFGPLGPIAGVFVGEAIGAILGGYFGGKFGGDLGEKTVEVGQKQPWWQMVRPFYQY